AADLKDRTQGGNPMPRGRAASHPFDALVHYAAEVLSARLAGVIAKVQPKGGRGAGNGRASANEKRSRAMKGRKLDMTCRVEGCRNRSGGPRWGFICDMHRNKLSAKAQQAAREAWKAKHAA